jgi:hypothetical protein
MLNSCSRDEFVALVDEVAAALNITPEQIDEDHYDLGIATLMRFPNSGEVVIEQRYLVRPSENLTAAESVICCLRQRRRERASQLLPLNLRSRT